MSQQTDFQDFVKEQMRQWKAIFDEMEVQMSLGKAEFRDAFAREKKNFEEFIQKRREEMKTQSHSNGETHKSVKTFLDDFLKSLDLPLSESNEVFEKNKQVLLHRIYELERDMRNAYDNADFLIKNDLNSLKAPLDDFRLQLGLCQWEDLDKLSEPKATLKDRLSAILDKMSRRSSEDEKINEFMKEMNTSIDHLRKAFSGLFS